MEIRPWSSDLAPATIDVLARAFAGNPLHVAAFGKESVVRRNAAFFQVGLSIFQGQRLAAMEGSKLVGFAHWVRSPACQMPIGQRLRLVPAMIHGLGLSGALRVSSWLVDLVADALARSPRLDEFAGRVSDSGEGRWTVLAAIDESVPAPVITAALVERFESRGLGEFTGKILSAMRSEFGGHAGRKQ
jgi:hypothetical protein